MTGPAQTVLPRWRGFNLLEMFTSQSDGELPRGRLPLDRRLGLRLRPAADVLPALDRGRRPLQDVNEPMLAKIDRAIELGRKYGLHVCLNFHRAPGYSVNPERKEPFNLWKDQAALDAFCFHWQLFAKRYRGIPSKQLSFNLVNEPHVASARTMTRADHERVIRGRGRRHPQPSTPTGWSSSTA